MYFILSKIFGIFSFPFNLIMVAAVAGVIFLHTRFALTGKRLLTGAVVSLGVIAVLPIGTGLTAALEDRFPPWRTTGAPPDGIIVLGGIINPELSEIRRTVVLGDAAERLTEAAALARRYPAARLVFVGGNSAALGGQSEAVFARQFFESLGIPAPRIELETQSRNTAENARFAKALIRPQPGQHWLLVTSAMHMPRAVGCFRKAGFPVEAYPVDWQTRGLRDLFDALLPPRAIDNVVRTNNAVHEWIALLLAWSAGLTSELFPGPEASDDHNGTRAILKNERVAQ